jgi:hypothetical protein
LLEATRCTCSLPVQLKHKLRAGASPGERVYFDVLVLEKNSGGS